METEQGLVKKEIEVVAETPNHLIALALQEKADPNTLSKLMDLQERWEAGQARKAFVAAMTAFKQEAPAVLKKHDQVDFTTARGRTRYNYANLGSIVQEITAILGKHQLSASWGTCQEGNNVTVTCHVTHIAGHRESVTLTGPIDESGNKNRIQAVGSTVTYLQRYTLLAALGLATGEDDDGRGGKEHGQTGPEEPEQNTVVSKKVVSQILNVKKKDGQTGNKKWSLYTIFGLLNGNETSFNTFDHKFADMAAKEKGTGLQFELEYEPTERGNNLKSLVPWNPNQKAQIAKEIISEYADKEIPF